MNVMELWFSKLSFNLKVFFIFPGPLRSSTCPPSGRSTSPHCSTHRSPPFTPPISVASCRCPRPLPHHACSEPCPKWKRTQGWERWEQTYISVQKMYLSSWKHRASMQIHTGCTHVNPYNPHPKYPYTNTHTQSIQIHIDPYLKWRMQVGDTLVHWQRVVWSSSCRFSQISLLECYEFVQFVRPAFCCLNTERQLKTIIHKSAVWLAAGCLIPF